MAAINPSTSKLWLRLVTRCSILFRNDGVSYLFFPSFFLLLVFFSVFFIFLAILWFLRDVWNVRVCIEFYIIIFESKNSEKKESGKVKRFDWESIDKFVNRLNRGYEKIYGFKGILIFDLNRIFEIGSMRGNNRSQEPVLSARKIFYQMIKLMLIVVCKVCLKRI